MAIRIGLAGIDSSHADDFLRIFNAERAFDGCSVTAFWSHEADVARVAEVAARHPEVTAYQSLTGLVDHVDAVIAGSRDGRLHREHALAAIAAGRPVFIDKPLANTLADGKAILDGAAHMNVPVCSASALRWQRDTPLIKARLAYLGAPLAVEINGTWYPESEYGGAVFYAIHAIELAQELLGTDWRDLRRAGETAVRCRLGPAELTLRFSPPRPEGSAFTVSGRSDTASFAQRVALPGDYMLPVAARVVEMVEAGRACLDREQLLAPLAMMAAIEAALSPPRRA